jgi:hypothetical protein
MLRGAQLYFDQVIIIIIIITIIIVAFRESTIFPGGIRDILTNLSPDKNKTVRKVGRYVVGSTVVNDAAPLNKNGKTGPWCRLGGGGTRGGVNKKDFERVSESIDHVCVMRSSHRFFRPSEGKFSVPFQGVGPTCPLSFGHFRTT